MRRAAFAAARIALAMLLAAAGPAGAAGDAAPARAAVDATQLPAPGRYRLPVLFAAPNGDLLGTDGRRLRLQGLLRGRTTVLSFVYSYCRDPDGCPRAWAALATLQRALVDDPALAAGVQILSISFDPTHDTPETMRLLGADRERDARLRWRFLTAPSVAALLPLLDGFGQDVSVETDARGRPTRTLNHQLKLFLVDARGRVREVYGLATLDPQALLNDLRTLQLDAGVAR